MVTQDLIVLGGGTSGFIVAIGALRLGLQVTLIEKHQRLGGLALHNGCVPSKALLHLANMAHIAQNAVNYGIESYVLPTDLRKINKYVNQVTNNLITQESQEIENIFAQFNGNIVYGQPCFIDEHTIEVNGQRLQAKKIVVATGSRPLYPAIDGLSDVGYITNEELFKQQKLWEKIVVLGDRPSAIEFAQAFARFGTKVSIVVRGDSILSQEDPELVEKLKEVLLQNGINLYLNTKVKSVYMQRKEKILECVHDSGDIYTLSADEIFIALGRRPNVEGLGLENAGVAYAKDGIIVDRRLCTARKNIYALGDVIRSPYKLTHIAEYQASILLSNMLFRYPAKVKYQGFPYVIFTDPEYAHVGLTEQQAKEHKYKKIEIFRFDFKDLDRAIINNSPIGMIKVVTSNKKIIGATILGAQASSLIAEWGLAINMQATLGDIAATVHAYPTFAQINRRVASKHISRNFFSNANRTLVGIMQRFGFASV
jgi:pyruvate/2-oxoglutarate dehydrogenase complex dihydrolipoamide dehydrogenase (E3) component